MLFAPLFILCIASIVGVTLVAMMGGGGDTAEQVTKERMARREQRAADPSNVTALPTTADSAPARDDAAA